MEELLTQFITLNYVIYFEYALAVNYDDWQTKQVYNGQNILKQLLFLEQTAYFKIMVNILEVVNSSTTLHSHYYNNFFHLITVIL